MSNAIRYDALLVRYLAEELDGRLRGARIEALELDPDRRTAAFVTGGADALVWRLHPGDGTVRLEPAPALPARVPLPRRATVRAIAAAPDERLLEFALDTPHPRPDRAARVVVELLGNQWNVAALDPAGRILAVLWPRVAGGRRLAPGAAYEPPAPSARRGADAPLTREAWRALLGAVPPGERGRALVAAVAYTSPINAGPILGGALESDAPEALDAAYDRYLALASLPAPSPCLLRTDRGAQPYPLPLPGVAAEPCPTLLAAMAAVSGTRAAPAAPAAPAVDRERLDRLRATLARIERRRARLARELADAAPEAAALRRSADLLLSQLYLARKGMTRVEVSDFEGGVVEIALDPALAPQENAQRLYEAARKRERAAVRLPRLIENAGAERDRLAALLARAEAGTATPEEVDAAVGAPAGPRPGRRGTPEAVLPYRRYRTSGGLEVRVGRGREANDALTFHHASPNDIWLHARDAAGAHVVLRWSDPQANPPARDLAEAATLAALRSKARTSGTVAVDWTRRKYVRKPRKAPPGLVVPERTRTVFVEPDPAVEARLRWNPPGS
ncbi:MAG TPA: NFACT RNA binding domain-containing protein [Longimicrobiales bacterium]